MKKRKLIERKWRIEVPENLAYNFRLELAEDSPINFEKLRDAILAILDYLSENGYEDDMDLLTLQDELSMFNVDADPDAIYDEELDEDLTATDIMNDLLSSFYDFCDAEAIWIPLILEDPSNIVTAETEVTEDLETDSDKDKLRDELKELETYLTSFDMDPASINAGGNFDTAAEQSEARTNVEDRIAEIKDLLKEELADVSDTDQGVTQTPSYAAAIRSMKANKEKADAALKNYEKEIDELIKENDRDAHQKPIKNDQLKKLHLQEDWDDELAEDTHAQYAKPEGNHAAAKANAMRYARRDRCSYIYGYTDRNGKFFALEQPIKACDLTKAEKDFRSKYTRCNVIHAAHPEKSVNEGREDYYPVAVALRKRMKEWDGLDGEPLRAKAIEILHDANNIPESQKVKAIKTLQHTPPRALLSTLATYLTGMKAQHAVVESNQPQPKLHLKEDSDLDAPINKAHLREDFEEIDNPSPAATENELKDGLESMLNLLIRDEYEAIQGYTDMLAMLDNIAGDDVDALKSIVKDIQDEEFLHVGQLQKCLELVSDNANKIADGVIEAEEQITEN